MHAPTDPKDSEKRGLLGWGACIFGSTGAPEPYRLHPKDVRKRKRVCYVQKMDETLGTCGDGVQQSSTTMMSGPCRFGFPRPINESTTITIEEATHQREPMYIVRLQHVMHALSWLTAHNENHSNFLFFTTTVFWIDSRQILPTFINYRHEYQSRGAPHVHAIHFAANPYSISAPGPLLPDDDDVQYSDVVYEVQ